ncbi:helix-turn-helix domain-containing protein [Paenibacillus sp. NPDC057967]|uniref:helix-turn-helix domain-containing protein n=1 Tax=Paenibacillus sp. NPDC057967 TaxID=3346293 RepID=UPI0036DE3D13
MSAGEVMSFASPATFRIQPVDPYASDWYMVSYSMHVTGGDPNRLEAQHPMLVPNREQWKVSSQRLTTGLNQLYDNRLHTDPFMQMAYHIQFQEWMMWLLMERRLHAGRLQEQNSVNAVQLTVKYMQSAYYEDITVDKLANEAQMSRRQFTQLFRQMTSRSVNEYLTELRIRKAKQLLLGGGQLADIAQAVGYREESYFYRRFKQTVGLSPRQYARTKQQQYRIFTPTMTPMRVVADQYMGELLKLDVVPVGVRTQMLKESFLSAGQRKKCVEKGTIDLGTGFPVSLSRISMLQPDLIVTQNEQQYNDLMQIAPTVLIPYQSLEPLEKLRKMSRIFEKNKLAEEWIGDYEWRAEQTRKQIQNKHGVFCSVTNLLLMQGKLFVLGEHGGYGSYSLYRSLGLEVPPVQRKIMNETVVSVPIEVNDLPAYAGEHIFVSSYDDISALTGSEIWNSLPAVQAGQVYFSNPYRFSFEDPYSLDDQLSYIRSCLLV